MVTEIERKFLLVGPPNWAHPVLTTGQRIAFEQVYLRVSEGYEERIRRGARDGVVTYHHTILTRIGPGVRDIVEREVDSIEYSRLRSSRDPLRQVVVKDRLGFHWREQFFELDNIHQPAARACQLLEIQLHTLEQEVILPRFLDVDREVTHEPEYSNAQIALG